MDEKEKFLDLSNYSLLNKIGGGAFSKVYRVKHNSTGEICAAKILKSEINDENINSEDMILLLREVNLMSSLNHPSILKFIGFNLNDFDQNPYPTIVTKLAPNGSLRDVLKLESSGLSPKGWDSTRKLINIYGIASGLAYLHLHDIIHRDIKPENILMDEYLFPNICDFGLSKITASVSQSMNMQSQSSIKGTPIYMAPEMMRNEPYTKSVDVYSFSIIVYEIMTGITPFQGMNLIQLISNVCSKNERPKLTKDIPIPYQNLMKACWADSSEDRPTFDEIVNILKTNKEFISDTINEEEYYDYIDFIDNYKKSFDLSHQVHFSDMLNRKGKESTITKVSISEKPQKVIEKEVVKHKVIESTQKVPKQNKVKTEKSQDISNFHTIPYFKECNYSEIESFFVDDDKYKMPSDDDDDDDEFCELMSNDPMRYIKVFSEETKQEVLCRIFSQDYNEPYIKTINQTKILKEAYTLKTINHPCIVKFLGLNLYNACDNLDFDDDDDDYDYEEEEDDDDDDIKTKITSFYEYPKNKSLQYIIDRKDKLTPVQRQIIIIGILLGLKYLHENDICHGQLCPQMIWLDENFYPKIYLDFFYNESNVKYQSLENIIEGKAIATKESDVFSFARLLYYLITGVEPFKMIEDENRNLGVFRLLNKICNENIFPLIPNSVPDKLKSILELCWDSNQFCRPTISDLIDFLVFSKDYYIDGVQSNENYRKINEFIEISRIKNNRQLLFVSYNYDASIEMISYTTTEILEKIIYSKFKYYNEKDTLEFLIKAENESIQKIEKHLHEIVDYVNKSKSELASQFLNIIFGEPIPDLNRTSLQLCTIVNIPNSVTLIPSRSFYGLNQIIKVYIPNSVKMIGNYAFCNCSSLEFINIPKSIEKESIGIGAFEYCKNLKRIKIPSKLTKIADETFKGDEKLSEVILNNKLEIIGNEAFSGCNELHSITIPKSIQLIDRKAFDNCKNLKSILFKEKEKKSSGTKASNTGMI